VLMRLREAGPLSQNLLGRETAMDPNTVQGVILRLLRRRLVTRSGSAEDKRRKLLSLTADGRELAERLVIEGQAITEETLAPLSAGQRRQFLGLLARLT
jgi:MarR family transcriptional regulator, lower aerobic nicotinate degradation pathway regulator